MGKNKELTKEKRSEIDILRYNGHFLNFVSKTIGVNKSSVSKKN